MKKQMFKNVLVLSLTALVMGVLIGLSHFVTAPIIRKNRDAKVVEIGKSVFPEGKELFRAGDIPNEYKKSGFETLSSDEEEKLKDYLFAFSESKEYLGLVAIGRANGYGGEMEIAIAINRGDLIESIKAVTFQETPGYGGVVLKKFEEEYQSAPLDYIADNSAGATESSNALKEAIGTVVTNYLNNKSIIEKIVELKAIVLDPVVLVFGDITETLDPSFTANEIVLERNNVEGTRANGYSYLAKSGTAKIKVFIDLEGLIKVSKVEEPVTEEVQAKLVTYLESLNDTKVADVETTISGVTSDLDQALKDAVKQIYLAVRNSHKETDPLYKAFGGDYVKALDETFTPTDTILERYVYTVDGVDKGYSYVGNKHYAFDTGYSQVDGNVKVEVIMAADLTIIGYEILEYNHSKGVYQTKVVEFLDAFIGTNANDISATITANKPLYAGATETARNTVEKILLAIEVEVKK
jgi:Na+-translocating ferredoxin:NAD+ oxidoreductase RnfG subunit